MFVFGCVFFVLLSLWGDVGVCFFVSCWWGGSCVSCGCDVVGVAVWFLVLRLYLVDL